MTFEAPQSLRMTFEGRIQDLFLLTCLYEQEHIFSSYLFNWKRICMAWHGLPMGTSSHPLSCDNLNLVYFTILDMSIVYFADEDPTSVQIAKQRGKHDFIEPDINTQPTHRIHTVEMS